MLSSSRFLSKFAVVALPSLLFLAAGCERKEPVAERKFKLLVEETRGWRTR